MQEPRSKIDFLLNRISSLSEIEREFVDDAAEQFWSTHFLTEDQWFRVDILYRRLNDGQSA